MTNNPTPQPITPKLDLLGANQKLAKVVDMDFENIYKLQDVKDRFDQKYDFCIIDSHPSLDRLQLAVLSAADYVIIPVKPAPYSLQGMTDLFNIIQRIKNRVNPNLQILGILISVPAAIALKNTFPDSMIMMLRTLCPDVASMSL